MKFRDRVKNWVGITEIENTRLLHRYGARNMDELWTMIVMDRTCEPQSSTRYAVENLIAKAYIFVKDQ